ncbi:C4-dicarboxylate-binding periplasmic protein [Curvibacter sp. AEP1-3]|jgi:TRAP-type C4-dicarboxylate transport system substrate-binding protein|uniref:TRAP transporter substrate-binding protein n=1 Tax=Curvibacter sp. AEP1-3 TaxID=1844971 RepID=UPI000B3CD8CD|nr:TRAP transporter substrate-binding protein [Curvibacter sp. AEP1-3]ARV20485.1 C4-dicarboxylate-binding periplasmic protein [Curvibacter sp. AEP1-3]
MHSKPLRFRKALSTVALAAVLAGTAGWTLAADVTMRVAGNFSSNVRHSEGIERPFFTGLPKATGIDMDVKFNPMDVVNVKPDDALRLLRSNVFDVMSVQIGSVARDDPFFEGIDLAGVSTNMTMLRESMEAYRHVFDQRLQEKFKAKALTLWPFGPQVFFCNKPIKSIADFKGLKIRSFTPSMSAMLQNLGATPVTLSFSEVYSALGNGVVDCGVTSANSGNSGKWPEVTQYFYPLSVAGSVQGHFVNIDFWNKLSPAQQTKISAEFKKMEDQMWALAEEGTADSIACNTGKPCKNGTPFKMTLVPVSADDQAKVKAASAATVLPMWKTVCNKVDPKCSDTWNATVGKARGMAIN